MAVPRYEYATKANSEPLGEPLTFHFSKRTAKNRLMKTAMAEMLSTWSKNDIEARGVPTKQLVELYRRWGEGGWGLLHTGNMMIDYHQMSSAGDALIPPDAPFEGERFEAFKAMAAAAKAHGSLIIAQVSHPGRQIAAKQTKESISASAVQLEPKLGMEYAPTRAATQRDIDQVIEGFAHAAAYLEAAGFDGINLHGAHGYLLAQFLSQTTNHRTDKYGGSLTNRMRLITEVCAAIRARTKPSFILSAKLNSVEFQSGGLTPDEASELVTALQETAAIDFVELSGGTAEELGMEWRKESTRRREAYFLEFAEQIVPVLGSKTQRRTKVYLTGGLRSVGAMVAVLEKMDGVGLAKPAAQEPLLAKNILAGTVEGAIKQPPLFEKEFMLALMAAGTQLRMIGQGKAPFDISDPEQATQFQKDLGAHFTALAEDGDKSTKFGYAEYTGPTKPYEEA